MKLLLQGIAVLLHPIFLPLYSILIYLPFVASLDAWGKSMGGLWLGFVYLFLPLTFFKVVRKINLPEPTLNQRITIYKTYTLINLGLVAVNIFLVKQYMSFFVAVSFLHLLLWVLAYIELKASWHAAAWAFLMCTALMIQYKFSFTGMPTLWAVLGGLLIAVVYTRYTQRAHNPFELVMGIAVGALSSSFILFF
jgi:hypothetical protein